MHAHRWPGLGEEERRGNDLFRARISRNIPGRALNLDIGYPLERTAALDCDRIAGIGRPLRANRPRSQLYSRELARTIALSGTVHRGPRHAAADPYSPGPCRRHRLAGARKSKAARVRP